MKDFVPILLAIIGVAIVAIIVSHNSNTTGVLGAGGSGFASAIRCAVSPITGGTCASSSSLLPTVTSSINYF